MSENLKGRWRLERDEDGAEIAVKRDGKCLVAIMPAEDYRRMQDAIAKPVGEKNEQRIRIIRR